ncbi:MAG: hypothetical protein Hals2KO_18800 [Halioglobus sp.]
MWLLRLVLPGRFGRMLTSVLIFGILLPVFYLGGGSDHGSIPALFFSTVIAYIIPIFSYITEKSREAVGALRPVLNLNSSEIEQCQLELQSANIVQTGIALLLGSILGGIHMSLVSGSATGFIERMLSSTPEFLSIFGSLLVWIVMTTVISMLLQQATAISRLASQSTRINLFNTRALLPFGRIAIGSSLAIIGALALFPLIGAEIGVDLKQILPGAIATLVPLGVIFLLPVWPVHRRVSALKETHLADIGSKIDQAMAQAAHKDGAAAPPAQISTELAALLVYRREVLDVSSWPFDLGNVTKLAFYMFIPPLTWVAAALIENLVDAML